MRQKIIDTIKKEKLIVILRGVDREKLIPLVDAMYRGGVRLLEITYSPDGQVSDEETSQRLSMLTDRFGDRMIIGSGTVLTEKQIELTRKGGGSLIISPNVNEAVIKATVGQGLVSIPGALTPSEIEAAHECGADFVKLFPVTAMGENYVKAVRAPLSHIQLLGVGGIDLNNIKSYLNAGLCGFGIGSNIVDRSLVAEGNWCEISRMAEQYCRAVQQE